MKESIKTGEGVYTFGTDTIIKISEYAGSYQHNVYRAGQKPKLCPIYENISDPIVSAMWAACGCFHSRRILGEEEITEAFNIEKPGVEQEMIIRPKIKFQGDRDYCGCAGEDEAGKCEGGCDLQDFIESAAKRAVTIRQIFKDLQTRCKHCRRKGF